jgi:hypothetical protein
MRLARELFQKLTAGLLVLGRSGCDSWSDTNPVVSKSFTTKKAMNAPLARFGRWSV